MAWAGRRVAALARRLAARAGGRAATAPTSPPGPGGSAIPPSVRVATDVGSLLLPAHDQLILPVLQAEGRWEPEEADLLRRLLRPGMVVVDVGAHDGVTNVEVVEAAASDRPGRIG